MNQKSITKHGKVEIKFEGFESLHDLDHELMWAIQDSDLLPDPEFKGTLRITLEYEEE
jgi:hypothetical protein